jgi:hypothetical protein
MSEKGRLFGTDGVRGTANVHPMTAEMALSLGQAIAHVFFEAGEERPRIIIGKDTRLSGYMFEDALTAGVCSMGVDVIQVGPMPTPAMAFLTVDMRCHAGVMISASHNPYQDNGIKFFAKDGFKLPDDLENRIERLIQSGELAGLRAAPEAIGAARTSYSSRTPFHASCRWRGCGWCSTAPMAPPTRWGRPCSASSARRCSRWASRPPGATSTTPAVPCTRRRPPPRSASCAPTWASPWTATRIAA